MSLGHSGMIGCSVRVPFSHGSLEVESLSTIPLNKWAHVACTYDEVTGDLTIYIDGKFDASGDFHADNPIISGDGGLLVGGPDFTGLIDEVELFNRALSAEEIKAIYDADTAGKCKDGGGDNEFHTECRGNTCAVVRGAGENRCSIDQQCGEWHSVCRFTGRHDFPECVQEPGPGDDECSYDRECRTKGNGER